MHEDRSAAQHNLNNFDTNKIFDTNFYCTVGVGVSETCANPQKFFYLKSTGGWSWSKACCVCVGPRAANGSVGPEPANPAPPTKGSPPGAHSPRPHCSGDQLPAAAANRLTLLAVS